MSLLGMLPGALLAGGTTTVVTKATTLAGIDWGHGVTTDVVLEWAVTIGCCLALIFGIAAVAVGFILERKKK